MQVNNGKYTWMVWVLVYVDLLPPVPSALKVPIPLCK